MKKNPCTAIGLSLSDSANTISQLELHHFRSPIVVLALVFLLTYFQNPFGFLLHSTAILRCYCCVNFIISLFTLLRVFLYSL